MQIDPNNNREGISLYGGGGHARVIADVLNKLQICVATQYEDDLLLVQDTSSPFQAGVMLSGKENFSTPSSQLIIGIGKNQIRQNIAKSLSPFNLGYACVTQPSATISDTVSIGEGSVVFSNAVLQVGTEVGMHVIINTSASIDHECKINDFAHISPNATLCGNVTVGEGAHIGAGATVIEGVKIGKWSTVGAGSVVIRDVEDFQTVVGCPAKLISTSNMNSNPINHSQSLLLEFINSIKRNTGKPVLQTISNEQSLQADLRLDSLDLAELTVLIESKCGIDIFKDGIVATVQDVLNKLPTE